MKKFLITLMLVLISLFQVVYASGEELNYETNEILSGDFLYENDLETLYETKAETYKGTVITAGIKYEEKDEWSNIITPYQDVRVEFNNGHEDKIVLIKYQLSYYLDSSIPADELNVGDKVYVTVVYDENKEIVESYIEYISNERFLVLMIVIYAGAIILIGGLKGLRALIGLVLTILAMFFVMIPLIFAGYSPLPITIITCVLVTILTFIIVSGFSKKTIAASLGTAGGIIVAGIFAIIFGNLMKLTGACSHSLQLSMIENGSRFNFESIMISGIIVGALGACMDVGMSIASALHELSVEGKGMTISKLIKSGMNIGKDVMGTMTNTLILAYVGSSLIVILLLKGYAFESYQVLNNTELVLEEVLRAIAGSFGLVFTIPITTFVSAILMGKEKSQIEGERFLNE